MFISNHVLAGAAVGRLTRRPVTAFVAGVPRFHNTSNSERPALQALRRSAGRCASNVHSAVRSAGYRYVTLDLEGFRSGNLNAALDLGPSG